MYCKEVLHSYLMIKLNRYDELENLLEIANEEKLDYHNFKNTKLPRVEKVLGILKGIRPTSLLDLGFGRGKFLYPLLEEFGNTYCQITAIEQQKSSIEEASLIQSNYKNLIIRECDLFKNNYDDKSFHTLTALEIMEHIEDTEKFLDECVRLSKEWIVLSVPSKEDENPEHIHLFTENKVTELFKKYNLTPKYEYVLNHMIIKVKI